MAEIRDQILTLFRKNPRRPLTSGELSGRLGLQRKERRDLRKTLADMTDAGSLERTSGGRYFLRAEREDVEGLIAFRSTGVAQVELDSGQAIPVPARLLGGAIPGDRVRAELLPPRHGMRRSAKVREILEHGPGQIVGIFRRAGAGGYVEPRDPDLFPHYLAVGPEATGGAVPGDLVVAQLADPAERSVRLHGRVVEVLGVETTAAAEVGSIAHHHGLRLQFPEAVLAEVAATPREVRPEDAAGRVDLRSVPLVTIDGEDARDFDDAVAVERLAGGGFRLRVAIADVSHYVREGTALDREALARGTSAYFPDRVLPMLPAELSNGLCSLRPDVDRLALCVDMILSAAGDVLECNFLEGVIRSHARLTYNEVQAAIDAGEHLRGAGDPTPMKDLCHVLSERRRERGSLDFDIPEARAIVDAEGGIVDVVRRERKLAHRIIEELMIAANEAVARHFELQEHPTVFRVHDEPDPEKLRAFCELAGSLGLRIRPEDAGNPRELGRFVAALGDSPGARALNALLLRSMKQAVYDVDNIGHYGLAAGEYLHFTSPIRRYPDLVVHRQLKRLLESESAARGGTREALATRLSDIATRSSARERAAMEAEREALAFYRALAMTKHVGEVFKGTVTGVVAFGVFVEIEKPFVDGLVHVKSLGDDYFEFVEENQTLVGRDTGTTFRLGDEIEVRVVEVSISRRQVSLEPANRGSHEGARPGQGRDKRRAERRQSKQRGAAGRGE